MQNEGNIGGNSKRSKKSDDQSQKTADGAGSDSSDDELGPKVYLDGQPILLRRLAYMA